MKSSCSGCFTERKFISPWRMSYCHDITKKPLLLLLLLLLLAPPPSPPQWGNQFLDTCTAHTRTERERERAIKGAPLDERPFANVSLLLLLLQLHDIHFCGGCDVGRGRGFSPGGKKGKPFREKSCEPPETRGGRERKGVYEGIMERFFAPTKWQPSQRFACLLL